jgi:hypothetical protein
MRLDVWLWHEPDYLCPSVDVCCSGQIGSRFEAVKAAFDPTRTWDKPAIATNGAGFSRYHVAR